MILLIDNYDSFTFNLYQYLSACDADVRVFRNDALSVKDVTRLNPDKIVLSPGPGAPGGAGICLDLIRTCAGSIPILGVCLGHQAIGQAFGGQVVRAGRLVHGKTSPIHHDGRGIFAGLPNPFQATRYHSLVVSGERLPACLEVSAWTAEGEIMGLRHMTHDIEGVQFHPESILTERGRDLLANFAHPAYSLAA